MSTAFFSPLSSSSITTDADAPHTRIRTPSRTRTQSLAELYINTEICHRFLSFYATETIHWKTKPSHREKVKIHFGEEVTIKIATKERQQEAFLSSCHRSYIRHGG